MPHTIENLDEGYNLASNLISIEGLQISYGPPKSQESQLWEFREDKMPFRCGLHGEAQSIS
jgi:hypothetical protein